MFGVRESIGRRERGIVWVFFFVWIIQIKADQPPMVTALTCMLSGQYSNLDQYQADLANNISMPDKHLWLRLHYTQVEVPALSPAAAIYYEQYINNASTPSRQQILAFTQTTETQIRMSSYNFVNAAGLSFPANVAALKNLSLLELSNRPDCDALWEQTGVGKFTSFLATPLQCTFMFFGKLVRPEGSRNLTCSGITFTEVFVSVSGNEVVSGTDKPYRLLRVIDS